jgi:hypothetical protein
MPGHEERMARWDQLPAAEAAARAWLDPGPQAGTWHRDAREDVEFLLPMLARALDRLVLELDLYPPDPLLWADVPIPEPRRRPGPTGRARYGSVRG